MRDIKRATRGKGPMVLEGLVAAGDTHKANAKENLNPNKGPRAKSPRVWEVGLVGASKGLSK